jgi:hypothetical protein
MYVVPVEEPPALRYVKMKGWPYQLTSNGEQMLMDCPICGKEKHFYLSVEKGLWDCKVCGRTGNLYALKKEMGEPIPGVQSMQESIPHALKPLPDIEKCHAALLADYDTLKWLTDERQFSIEVIESMRLGLWEEFGKKYVTYPYINGGKYQFLKGRTVPPQPKDFLHADFLTGRQNPLYHAHPWRFKGWCGGVVFVEVCYSKPTFLLDFFIHWCARVRCGNVKADVIWV